MGSFKVSHAGCCQVENCFNEYLLVDGFVVLIPFFIILNYSVNWLGTATSQLHMTKCKQKYRKSDAVRIWSIERFRLWTTAFN
jgi:hypothetical protein